MAFGTVFVWVKWDGEGDWEPHMSFDPTDSDDSTTIASDATAEIMSLKEEGHKAKRGPAFPER